MQSHSERKPGDEGYEQISKKKLEDGSEEEVDYGRRFAVKTDYGQWDKDYTLDDLEKVINEFYRILRRVEVVLYFLICGKWKL